MEQNLSLRERVRINREKRQRRQIIFIVVMTLIFGSWFWYETVFTRTPEYALDAIKSAVTNKDGEKFKKYLNTDLVVGAAYADLTIDLFDIDGAAMSSAERAMFKRFYTNVRPQLIGGTIDLIMRKIERGEWIMPEGIDILKGNQLGIDYELFVEQSLLRSTEIGEIKSITRSDKTATAELEVVSSYTKKPFVLNLLLEQTEEGHWQVIKITNYRAYLTSVAAIMKRDITGLVDETSGLVANYNNTFTALRSEFQAMTKKAQGSFNPNEKEAFRRIIEERIIPTLKARQADLDKITYGSGAEYFAKLRKSSTETTIAAWEHFNRGIQTGDLAEFNKAEILHKREMEIDRRIETMISSLGR